jgi:ubiquinone/menaquinone biosynthesis C-methylase UbiE
MPEMSRFEKRFVNRRGERSYTRMLDRMDRAGQLPFAPTSQVLELGAGNGVLTMLVHERYHPARMWLTDYDPDQLSVARKNVEGRYGGVPSWLVLEQGDATHLGYADGTFDWVLAHHMLHHLGSDDQIRGGLDEIARVLRPGGRLLYVEMFRKRVVRDHLVTRGFAFKFRERAWRIFNTADVVIAERPPAPPAKV